MTPTAKQPTMESSLSARGHGAAREIAGDGIVESDGAIVVVHGVGNFHGLALARA